MIKLDEALRVHLYTAACDMRRGFDTLSSLVVREFGTDVRQGGVYVFFSRSKDRVKILWWDSDGYALYYKRLEVGTFRVSSAEGREVITGLDLELLLKGMDLKRIKFRRAQSTNSGELTAHV